MKYRVSESSIEWDDAPEYTAVSAEDAARQDATACDGLSDSFISYVKDEEGRVYEIEMSWVPGQWSAEQKCPSS